MEEILNAVALKTGLSKEEITAKIKEKQNELSGLVSEEGAAYIIANELGVKTRNRIIENVLKIKDIMPEMKSVTVYGRVSNIIGPREFTTKKGAKSKVANLDILDSTGATRVVLWNMGDIDRIEKAELKVGDIIQIKNGYVREGFRGGFEVNLGTRGILVTKPDDANEEDFPKVEEGKTMKMNEIVPGSSVSLVGKVTNLFGINEFDKNGRKGQVGNLILADGNGTVKLVLWNEQADLLKELNVGDVLKVDNAFAKEGLRGLEVQANWATKIFKNPEGVDLSDIKIEAGSEGPAQSTRIKIVDLKEGDNYKELRGVIVNVYGDKYVYNMCPNCNKAIEVNQCAKCGEVQPNKLLIVNAMIDDGTGTIRSVFFRENAEKLVGMKTDEIVSNLEGAKAKIGNIVGKEKLLEGRVKRNEMMDRLEFTVYNINDVNPAQEAEQLVTKIS